MCSGAFSDIGEMGVFKPGRTVTISANYWTRGSVHFGLHAGHSTVRATVVRVNNFNVLYCSTTCKNRIRIQNTKDYELELFEIVK